MRRDSKCRFYSYRTKSKKQSAILIFLQGLYLWLCLAYLYIMHVHCTIQYNISLAHAGLAYEIIDYSSNTSSPSASMISLVLPWTTSRVGELSGEASPTSRARISASSGWLTQQTWCPSERIDQTRYLGAHQDWSSMSVHALWSGRA